MMNDLTPARMNMTEADQAGCSSGEPGNKSASAPKQAACLNCRTSKTRCSKDVGDLVCNRCRQTQLECVIPDYRIGRKKGVKNKRDGLDKVVYQMEQALKKSKSSNQTSPLQKLLDEAQSLFGHKNASVKSDLIDAKSDGSSHQQSPENKSNSAQLGSEDLDVDDVENPLQLLARASDISSVERPLVTFAPHVSAPTSLLHGQEVDDFFSPFRPSLDTGEHLDPIDLGLITLEECDGLFTYFYDRLAHTRWGLDSVLHTSSFVRQRSAFLFTTILAASSLFLPSTAALAKRLSNHSEVLVRNITANKHRSPEIVLGLMISMPWMQPGKHWSDDETCNYMSMALTMSVDIHLNKVIVAVPSGSEDNHGSIPQGETITARKALDIDGFKDIDPFSLLGRRLLRRRERTWLAIFVLDRGVCLARGRNFTVPATRLILTCNNWHQSDIADEWDGSLNASTVFRRDLGNLISRVKDDCDHYQETSITSVGLQKSIDDFFSTWYTTWPFAIGGVMIPPYLDILVTHGRLSIYSAVINHPTAPVEVKHFFRAAGLSSALSVMRAAVQGERRLQSMPNNSVIMVSFSAMISFRLSTTDKYSNNPLAPSVRALIDETADMLIRIGSNPPHRNGISTLYGRHLKHVMSTNDVQKDARRPTAAPISSLSPTALPDNMSYMPQLNQMSDVHFSTMSDDQIYEAINAAGDGVVNDMSFTIEGDGLDWLDWYNVAV
ncbi:hypothetical protein BJ878DRAFT_85362 [Calycina marina]|uniref:Zn(2)-C6 fungal-type domain-containing protein n=1 Tax=Calycina marina TaxID=1763456 RepID=A0A9P7Z2J4_9HELO|nr:hypothetical protein BJ878DRAFT_85362 [Calycina marina]